ncbi:hypothetical protein Nepgr_002434 [Nepenthes gracilis]|uniref:Uncharacterized protein n=1 Tax=Nepenthes gracilis TaxID=150966 RepID=A0AAD3P7V5_NEPGR|nr:hypothetical protein Nepgr_002434 [Nepenthes gracilis]
MGAVAHTEDIVSNGDLVLPPNAVRGQITRMDHLASLRILPGLLYARLHCAQYAAKCQDGCTDRYGHFAILAPDQPVANGQARWLRCVSDLEMAWLKALGG